MDLHIVHKKVVRSYLFYYGNPHTNEYPTNHIQDNWVEKINLINRTPAFIEINVHFSDAVINVIDLFYRNIVPRADWNKRRAAGVNSTIISEGKINTPIGTNILIGALWASSSANWLRRILI